VYFRLEFSEVREDVVGRIGLSADGVSRVVQRRHPSRINSLIRDERVEETELPTHDHSRYCNTTNQPAQI
jgi:hypothetical protein